MNKFKDLHLSPLFLYLSQMSGFFEPREEDLRGSSHAYFIVLLYRVEQRKRMFFT
jgi:hypothetical protein